MTTLNPGYYNNTSCSPGGVEMPNSSLNPVTLTPVCNPIDKQLINTILNYLISNDLFILNQLTNTQQTPGLFNIYSYGKANAFLSKWFHLLDSTGLSSLTFNVTNHTINSLGLYYGPKWSTLDNYTIVADNVILDSQLILRTDLPSTLLDTVLTVDNQGIVNEVLLINLETKAHSLQQIASVGNTTSHTLVLLNATTNYELVPYGQMISTLLNIVATSTEVLDTINALIILVQNNDPIVQSILDSLILYIPLIEKGVLGGVLTLDLTNKIPIGQLPLITLQNICTSGLTTSTTIAALDANLPTELVTLGQLTAIINNGAYTLNQVLTVGNTTTLDIVIANGIYTNTISNEGITAHLGDAVTYSTSVLGPGGLFLTSNSIDYSNAINIRTSGNNTELPNRLLVTADYVLTTADFGHNPTSTLGIDLDKLDGKHGSEYILHAEFPINLTGLVANNVLKFNGTTWVAGTVSGSGGGLTYLVDSITNSTYATLAPTLVTNSLFLKSLLNANILFGSTVYNSIGENNFSYTKGVGANISGNSNVVFANTGLVAGSNNYIFTASPSISSSATNNFVVNNDSQINGSSNIAIFNDTLSSSTYQHSASYSTFLQNTNTTYGLALTGQNSFVLNNNAISLSLNNVVVIGSNVVTVTGSYATVINAQSSSSFGNYSFLSGRGNSSMSYATVTFGSYATSELFGYSASNLQTRDRALVIGNGTSNSVRSNALTLWKSGAMQIQGALLLGTTDTNETGSPITGMIRNNSGTLEIYRSGWQKNLNADYNMYGMYNGFAYNSMAAPFPKTIVGGTNVFNDDHTLRIGDVALFTGDINENDEITRPSSTTISLAGGSVYQINANFELLITSPTVGDQIRVSAVLNGDTQTVNSTLYGCSAISTLYTTKTSVNFSFMLPIQTTSTLQFYIEYLTGVASHDVSLVKEGTRIDIHKIFSNAILV